MNPANIPILSIFGLGVILTLVVGFYGVLATRNLVRVLIGMEILTKSVTLLLILAGYLAGQVGLAQALAITLIVIEVVVIVVAISLVVSVFKSTGVVDTRVLKEIKG